ncbi:monocyte chemotactic protein 1B-like [Arapaima gigas]
MKTLILVIVSLSILLLRCACASSVPTSCCLKTQRTRVNLDLLQRYHTQMGVCLVKAVQFTTIKGKILCSDPSDPWAQRAISYLDGKNRDKKVQTSIPSTQKPQQGSLTQSMTSGRERSLTA